MDQRVRAGNHGSAKAGKAVTVWLKRDTIKKIRRLADELYEGNFSMAARVAMQRGTKDLPAD